MLIYQRVIHHWVSAKLLQVPTPQRSTASHLGDLPRSWIHHSFMIYNIRWWNCRHIHTTSIVCKCVYVYIYILHVYTMMIFYYVSTYIYCSIIDWKWLEFIDHPKPRSTLSECLWAQSYPMFEQFPSCTYGTGSKLAFSCSSHDSISRNEEDACICLSCCWHVHQSNLAMWRKAPISQVCT